MNFDKENLAQKILSKFGMRVRKKDLKDWKKLARICLTRFYLFGVYHINIRSILLIDNLR